MTLFPQLCRIQNSVINMVYLNLAKTKISRKYLVNPLLGHKSWIPLCQTLLSDASTVAKLSGQLI